MIKSLCSSYRNVCTQIQNNYPDLPKDTFKSAAYGFLGSVAFSIILSGGNPIGALAGGALSVTATAIYVVTKIALKKFLDYVSAATTGRNPGDLNDGNHVIAMFAYTTVLYTAKALDAGVNYKASLMISIFTFALGISDPYMMGVVTLR